MTKARTSLQLWLIMKMKELTYVTGEIPFSYTYCSGSFLFFARVFSFSLIFPNVLIFFPYPTFIGRETLFHAAGYQLVPLKQGSTTKGSKLIRMFEYVSKLGG